MSAIQQASDAAGVATAKVDAMIRRERDRFLQSNPRSRELAERCAPHWHHGVPMHWMLDWPTPFPLFVADASGATLTDVDGHRYDDFCLGDTGSMFGHSPPAGGRGDRRAGQRAASPTCCRPRMRPSSGELLARAASACPSGRSRPRRPTPTASRSAVARAVTGRPRCWSSTAAITAPSTRPSCASRTARPVNRPGLVGQAVDLTADDRGRRVQRSRRRWKRARSMAMSPASSPSRC